MKKVFLAFFLLFSVKAFCSGPFYIYPPDKGGTACKWKDGIVNWYYDKGDLTEQIKNQPKKASEEKLCEDKAKETKGYHEICGKNLKMCGIVKCVELLFDQWQAQSFLHLGDPDTIVNAVQMKVTEMGSFGEDIDDGNFNTTDGFLDKKKLKNNAVLVIFDEGGKIIKKSGNDPEASDSNYAVTQVYCDSSTGYYTGGWILLNPFRSGEDVFYASIFHEIGHAFGLDHSQPAKDVLKADFSAIVDDTGIQTMFPWIIESETKTAGAVQPMADLHKDDIIGLSRLYPSQAFKDNFCTVSGVLKDSEGEGYPGINVIAYPQGESSYADSVTFVSGALNKPCTHNGNYSLPGLVPGKAYNIVYEPVFGSFQNFEHGMNPYVGTAEEPGCSLLPASDETGGTILTGDGLSYVACKASLSAIDKTFIMDDLLKSTLANVSAGDVSIYDKKTINIADTTLTTKPGVQPPAEGEDKKKGWCMSVGGGFEPKMGLGIFVVILLLGLRRCHFSKNS